MLKRIYGVRLFDFSRTYRNIENHIQQEKLPQEDNMLTLAGYGKNMDFYILKGIVENILDVSYVKRYEIASVEDIRFLSPRKNCKNNSWK